MISIIQVAETAPFSVESCSVIAEYLVSQDNKRRVRPTNEKNIHTPNTLPERELLQPRRIAA